MLNKSGNPAQLYDVATEISALYSTEIDDIADALERMAQQHGLQSVVERSFLH